MSAKNRTELHYRNKYITLVKHSRHKQDAFQEFNGCNYYVILFQGTILFINFTNKVNDNNDVNFF